MPDICRQIIPASRPKPVAPCLQGDGVAFTGTLASMTHRQGASPRRGARWDGDRPHQPADDDAGRRRRRLAARPGRPTRSQKLRQATEWQQHGRDIKILNESQWLHLLGLEERRLAGKSIGCIRRQCSARCSACRSAPLTKLGAIGVDHAGRRKVCRLPYFDFQEVTCTSGCGSFSAPAFRGRKLRPVCVVAERARRHRATAGPVEHSWPATPICIIATGRTAWSNRAAGNDSWISIRRRRLSSRPCKPPMMKQPGSAAGSAGGRPGIREGIGDWRGIGQPKIGSAKGSTHVGPG